MHEGELKAKIAEFKKKRIVVNELLRELERGQNKLVKLGMTKEGALLLLAELFGLNLDPGQLENKISGEPGDGARNQSSRLRAVNDR